MLHLFKYRTLGSDFLLVDNRDGSFNDVANDEDMLRRIGERMREESDGRNIYTGLIEIQSHDKQLFQISHHTAVGKKGAACGSGSRCAIAFVRDLGIVKDGEPFHFKSFEGLRKALVDGSRATLSMSDDCKIVAVHDKNNYHVDPKLHAHVRFIDTGLDSYDIIKHGKLTADREDYKKISPTPSFMLARVNDDESISVRSFDRMSNDVEVYANGTGETSVAMSYMHKYGLTGKRDITIHWRDGDTMVSLSREHDGSYNDVIMSGDARFIDEFLIDSNMI